MSRASRLEGGAAQVVEIAPDFLAAAFALGSAERRATRIGWAVRGLQTRARRVTSTATSSRAQRRRRAT